MFFFIAVWVVGALLAGLIPLLDPERKAKLAKNNTSFAKSYFDAVKEEYGLQR